MGFFLLTALVFGCCHCGRAAPRFIPPCLLLGLFLWMEAGYQPGPDCGIRTAAELALIGACAMGIALGWAAYGVKQRFK